MTKFSEEILGKIKQEHIAPVPRWHFLMKGYFFWTLFALSILLGSLSFSVIVHIARFGDLDMFGHLHGDLATSTVMMLPYFWLLSVSVFAAVAYVNWKSTKLGYRYKRRYIVTGSVFISLFFGSIFNAIGMGKVVDNMMTVNMPFYDKSKHEARKELWLRPEDGLLIGKIINIDEVNEELIVQDDDGNNWSVNDADITWENKALEKKGKIVKVVGKKDGENKFAANEIRRCNDCQDDEDEDEDPAHEKEEKKKKKEVKIEDEKETSNENENTDDDKEDSRE